MIQLCVCVCVCVANFRKWNYISERTADLKLPMCRPLKGIKGVQPSDVTSPHTHILEICVTCHWLLKRSVTLSRIIRKIHDSERRAADGATTDASLQISSNFYFKFWTLVPSSLSLSIDFREMPNGPGEKVLWGETSGATMEVFLLSLPPPGGWCDSSGTRPHPIWLAATFCPEPPLSHIPSQFIP